MDALITALVSGAACGLVSWGALRTEIKFLWREIERQDKRLSALELKHGGA